MPGIFFPSTVDASEPLLGFSCIRTEKPVGASWSSWATFWKILRLIERAPG